MSEYIVRHRLSKEEAAAALFETLPDQARQTIPAGAPRFAVDMTVEDDEVVLDLIWNEIPRAAQTDGPTDDPADDPADDPVDGEREKPGAVACPNENEDEPPKGGPLAQQAAMLCNDRGYQTWVGEASAEKARDAMCKALNITSRRELDHDDAAAARFRNHRAEYQNWQAGYD